MPPPIPIYAPAPRWGSKRSRYLRLYHGCTSVDEANIRRIGIDPTLGRPGTDFGRGFYTTTVLRQARQWAWARFYDPAVSRVRPNQPVVLRFVVDRWQLADLSTLAFVLGGHNQRDFWSLVQHCRRGTKRVRHHRGPQAMHDGGWYDVVYGPVSAFWRQRYAMLGADQVSFHTRHSVRLLQQLVDGGRADRFRVITLT